MRNFLIFLALLVVTIGAVGYWRGWYTVSNEGKVEVKVDEEKVKRDREAFSKAATDKAKKLKEQVASLRTKSDGLTGDEKAAIQKELDELTAKHDRLERQIKELDDAGPAKFETIKEDLSKNSAEVEKRIAELTTKLERAKEKKE